jgi:hypothetical protein
MTPGACPKELVHRRLAFGESPWEMSAPPGPADDGKINLPMVSKDDWRRMGQERFLKGGKFRWQRYVGPGPAWDHDHCEFCFAKFMDRDEADLLREGWATPYFGSESSFRWVCPQCFDDFKEEFEFDVAQGMSDSSGNHNK